MSKVAKKAKSKEIKAEGKKYILRLFIAGDEPNSKQARENLEKLCETHLKGHYKVEIVDVLEDFKAALENDILLTPALLVVAPEPATIFGNLSEKEKVLAALGLTGGEV